jgi:hypothetical protein
MARRRIDVFSLSFLDAMTCGFGAIVLFFMVINASVGERSGRMTSERRAEADRLELEVLDGYKDLVEIRNSLLEADEELVATHGLAVRLIESLTRIQAELATFDESTLARQEHVNRLKTDLKSMEEEARRLSAAAPGDDTPGDRMGSRSGAGACSSCSTARPACSETRSSTSCAAATSRTRSRSAPTSGGRRSGPWTG